MWVNEEGACTCVVVVTCVILWLLGVVSVDC